MTSKFLIKWINDARGAVQAGATASKLSRKLNALEKNLKKTGKVSKKTVKDQKEMSKGFTGLTFSTKDFTKALARVAVVAPLWMAFRLVLRTITSTIRNATEAYLVFQKELGRVATVTKTVGATAKEFEKLEKAAISFAITSTATMKGSATAIYQLSTAGLSATEAMGGFEHVMNLSIGTMTDVNQTGKLMAGAFKLFGREMDNNLNAAEKFKKISDILATTFKTQQVELSEVATAFGFAANAANSIEFEFEALVATIGFLNTGMLKGSKAGTSLTNAMIKMSKNASLLEDATGQAFDPNKPIDFVNTMQLLNKRFKEGKLSLTDDVKLIQSFGLRGVRAIKSILQRWDEWEAALDRNKGNVEGAAEDMREAFEDNVTAQMEVAGQQFGELTAAIVSKVDGPIVKSLKTWSKAMSSITTAINENDISKITGFYALAMTGNAGATNTFSDALDKVREKFDDIGNAVEGSKFIELLDKLKSIQAFKWAAKLTKDLVNALGLMKAIEKIKSSMDKGSNEGKKDAPARDYRLEGEFKRDLEVMKAGGATSLQLAQETVDYLTIEKDLANDINSVMNARNKLEVERLKLIVKQAKEVRKMVSSSLSEAIKSGDINSFAEILGTKLRETVIDNVSEGLVNSLANSTNFDVTFGQVLEGTKIERAIITGADYHGKVITEAMHAGATGIGKAGGAKLIGGFFPDGSPRGTSLFNRDDKGILSTQQVSIAPADYYKTGGNSSLFQKGKGIFDGLGGIQGLLGIGLLGAAFSSGGKGSATTGNAFAGSISPETSTASTRSSTVAKVTNIQISPTFVLDGASINDENTIKESAQKTAELMKENILSILENADIATGNI